MGGRKAGYMVRVWRGTSASVHGSQAVVIQMVLGSELERIIDSLSCFALTKNRGAVEIAP